jgi:hypothetical protein
VTGDDIAVVSWGPGGNLPPLLATARLMAARGHRVRVLASAATGSDAERDGFDVHGYVRAPDPDPAVPFERQARAITAVAAGADVALDVRDFVARTGSSVAIVDCMLPAGLAGAAAAGVRAVSLVHFPYGLARRQIVGGDAWTTDLRALESTRRALGLTPAGTALTAWEAVDLLLVTAPRWFEVEQDYPAHVVHAARSACAPRFPRRRRAPDGYSSASAPPSWTASRP